MADLADVEQALVSTAVAALYPTGTVNASVLGVDCRVYRGWPLAASLDADLRAGKLNVSVYAQPNVERNTTRFPIEWKTMSVQAPLITLTLAGNVVTVGGTIQTGDVATIKIGHAKAYSVAVQSTSTLAGIATALAALVAVDFTASSVGAVITISTGAIIIVAVGGTGTGWKELRRQQKGFQVIVWASSPAQRDTATALIDLAFAKIEAGVGSILALADGQRLTPALRHDARERRAAKRVALSPRPLLLGRLPDNRHRDRNADHGDCRERQGQRLADRRAAGHHS